MSVVPNIDGIENAQRLQKPPPELLPFLNALTELLAKQVLHELRNPCDQTEATSAALASCEMTQLQVEEFPLRCHRRSEQ